MKIPTQSVSIRHSTSGRTNTYGIVPSQIILGPYACFPVFYPNGNLILSCVPRLSLLDPSVPPSIPM